MPSNFRIPVKDPFMKSDLPNLVYEQRATNDIDELFSWDEGWDFDYLQLSRGKLGFRSRLVQFGKLRIEWHSYNQRVLFRDALKTDDLAVALVVSTNCAPRFAGRDVCRNTLLIHQTDRQKEYIVEPGTTALHITVGSELLSWLNCDVPRDFLLRAPQDTVSRVIEVCEDIALLASPTGKVSSLIQAVQRERVLCVLQEAIAASSVGANHGSTPPIAGNRDYLLTRVARDYMARYQADARIAVGEIAQELDVSERTLYNAFRHWLGVGPYQYFVTCKLHAFRRQLITGQPFPGKITRAALAAGFDHLGQMGQLYRRHFGESPSQTLKRRAR